MSQVNHSLPSSVYWRRRLVVLGGLFVVIAVIVLIIVRPGFGTTATDPEPAGDPVAEVVTVANCLPSQIELVAKTDQSTYDSGIAPQLWLSVTNTSSVECTVAVGTDQQRYVVTSGDDQIWASDDCQTTSAPMEITLTPGEQQETTALQWDRTRSTPETCDDVARPTMPGGGASYHLEVFLGDVGSGDTKQFLLN
jgi:hypothetical protein